VNKKSPKKPKNPDPFLSALFGTLNANENLVDNDEKEKVSENPRNIPELFPTPWDAVENLRQQANELGKSHKTKSVKKQFTNKREISGWILFYFFLIVIPILLQGNVFNWGTRLKWFVRIGTARDWFGFWASYLGSMLSISFAYFNTRMQLKAKKVDDDFSRVCDLKRALIECKNKIGKSSDKFMVSLDNREKIQIYNQILTSSANFFGRYDEISERMSSLKFINLEEKKEIAYKLFDDLNQLFSNEFGVEKVKNSSMGKEINKIIEYEISLSNLEDELTQIIKELKNT